MKIKQLIKKLQNIKDQDSLVVLATDSEGNGYSVLEEVHIEDGLAWDREERDLCFNKKTKDSEGEFVDLNAPSAIILFP